jgi:hypothetical protein
VAVGAAQAASTASRVPKGTFSLSPPHRVGHVPGQSGFRRWSSSRAHFAVGGFFKRTAFQLDRFSRAFHTHVEAVMVGFLAISVAAITAGT